MTTKLNMKQLFVDAFSFLRTQTVGLLPLLGVVILAVLAAEYVTSRALSLSLSSTIVLIIEFVGVTAVSVIAYRRGLGIEGTRGVFPVTLTLCLAHLLVAALFGILGTLLLVFMALFAGILLGADGVDLTVSLTSAEDLYALVSTVSPPVQIILGALLVLALAAVIWMLMRLVLFGIATAVHERVMIFRTWGWTKGHALRILAFGVVFVVPAVTFVALAEATYTTQTDAITGELGGMAAYTIFTTVNFLLGHAVAVAIYKQLAPKIEDYEDTFG